MANLYKTAVAPRNAAMDVVGTRLNGGRIEIRGTPRPANISDASSGDLLATLTFAATAYNAASGGAISAQPINSDTNAAASGDAVYYREYQNGGADNAAENEGNCGDAGDAPVDLQFDNKTIVATGTVAISSSTKTLAEV